MLALKECLIREGVLNLVGGINNNNNNINNNTNNNRKHNLNRSSNGSYDNLPIIGGSLKLDNKLRLQKSVTSSQILDNSSASNLSSSASATANTSCQQQQPQKDLQQSNQPTRTKRYQGQHPHFHHHTAPAYYTDINLRIHTPDVSDVAALNENYQSVYATPSKLLEERHFPKTTTATVAPPPIGAGVTRKSPIIVTNTSSSPLLQEQKQQQQQQQPQPPVSAQQQARAAFFRGGSAGNERKSLEPFAKLSPTFASPTKGDFPCTLTAAPTTTFPTSCTNADGSVVFACTNFKPTNNNSIATLTVDNAANRDITNTTPTSASSSSRSRNPHRFNGRKRAVRVRSESRPISALYDIICKEKGLDIGTTTTNDEDSSPTHDHNNDDNHNNSGVSSESRERSRKTHRRNSANTMSGGLDSSTTNSNVYEHTKRSLLATARAQANAPMRKKKDSPAATGKCVYVNDLSDDERYDRKPFKLKPSPKKTSILDETTRSKASSMPPYLVASDIYDHIPNPNQNHFHQHHHSEPRQQPQQQQHANNQEFCPHHQHQQQPPHSQSPSQHLDQQQHHKVTYPSSSAARNHAVNAPDLVSNHNYVYPPTKLYVEPVNLHLSDSPYNSCNNHIADASKNAVETASAGTNNAAVAYIGTSPRPEHRGHRTSMQRKLREEKRRNTDGAINMLPSRTANALGDGCDTDEESEQKYATNARRFINRPNRTPSRSRSSANGSAAGSSHHSDDSSSPSPVHRSRVSDVGVGGRPNSAHSNSSSSLRQHHLTSPRLRSPAKSPLTTATNGNHHSAAALAHLGSGIRTTTAMTNSAAINAAAAASNGAVTTAAANATTVGHHITEISNNTTTATANVISDKKKDEEFQKEQQQRYSSPTSPRTHLLQSPRHHTKTRRHSSSSDNQKSPAGSENENKYSSSSSPTHQRLQHRTVTTSESSPTKKLIPSVLVSVKQNLSEQHFQGTSAKNTASTKLKKQRAQTAECTIKISAAGKTSSIDADTEDIQQSLNVSTTDDVAAAQLRPRSSTMCINGNDDDYIKTANSPLDLSPVHRAKTPESSPVHSQSRDKSSKRKSNLNRSLNEEATQDGDESAAVRRRRRRELGMARQLIPNNDPLLREIISPQKPAAASSSTFTVSKSPPAARKDLAFHMENARRGLDLVNNPNTAERRRAQTTSPMLEAARNKTASRINRRSDTLHLGELRKLRSNDVNRKLNERTKSDLAEIMKIAEMANAASSEPSTTTTELTDDAYLSASLSALTEPIAPVNSLDNLTYSINRISASHDNVLEPAKCNASEREPSPVKHATFVQEAPIYYEPEPSEPPPIKTSDSVADNLRQRILKARSVERDAGHEPPKLSPILRRKSTDDPTVSSTVINTPSNAVHNHIVSILKKKDHIAGESSSASSNASPVTFSANVIDTPTKQKRAGILKKRSSLDESRYYSRSHSPDERSILIKSARRNSLEETAAASQQQQHGILKQSSYDSSKSDGCPSATEPHPHGILKKKDSNSTPSDGGSHAPKHVSISQAVILAAAELCRESADASNAADYEEIYTPSNEDYDIRPILKLESASIDNVMRQPKPILKKKSSGDSDEHEIRPILKTSRKSSREEFDLGAVQSDDARHLSEPNVRPILKTDSPSKRRSLGHNETHESIQRSDSSPSLLKRRTRSLERQDAPVVDLAAALNAIATSQTTPVEFSANTMTVAERIKSMEKFLNNQQVATPLLNDAITEANTSWESPLQSGAVPKILKPSAIKRDLLRDRYKTQPVTSDEKNFFKATSTPFDTSATSAFKPTKSLDALNYVAFANLPAPSTTANNNTTYTLARSLTQPIQRQQSITAPTAGSPAAALATRNRFSSITDDTSLNISEQLTLSLGSDSERIFEMSGIEQDDAVELRHADESTPTTSSSSSSGGGGGGVARQNSVRARASMFQQLQEKTKTNAAAAAAAALTHGEQRMSPPRAQRRLSPASSHHMSLTSEPKTPNNASMDPDEEIEPSSLPLSERLRFFSSLSEAAAANRSSTSSYTRSPPHSFIERSASTNSYYMLPSTPRSSTSTTPSSASVTPTPMECSPIIHDEIPTDTVATASSDHTDQGTNGICESSIFIKLAKSSSHSIINHSTTAARDVPAAATSNGIFTTKRYALKTIGKLMLPQPFLNNDRNNNNKSNNISNNESLEQDMDASARAVPIKKIGKIKSPFIENCQQLQQKQQLNSKCMKYDLKSTPHNALASLENNDVVEGNALRKQNSITIIPSNTQNVSSSSDEANADSGKENYEDAAMKAAIQHVSAVVEMRKKFTRIMSSSSVNCSSSASVAAAPIKRQQSISAQQRNTYHGASSLSSACRVDDKFAKYFGLAVSKSKEQLTAIKPQAGPTTVAKRNMQNASSAAMQFNNINNISSDDEFMQDLSSATTTTSTTTAKTTAMAINRNVRLNQTNGLLSPARETIFATTSITTTPTATATNATMLRRREMFKRPRAITTIISTPSPVMTAGSTTTPTLRSTGDGSTSVPRAQRMRAFTITHGVVLPKPVTEVKKYEDIVVTKEEFQMASKEFERIFVGII